MNEIFFSFFLYDLQILWMLFINSIIALSWVINLKLLLSLHVVCECVILFLFIRLLSLYEVFFEKKKRNSRWKHSFDFACKKKFKLCHKVLWSREFSTENSIFVIANWITRGCWIEQVVRREIFKLRKFTFLFNCTSVPISFKTSNRNVHRFLCANIYNLFLAFMHTAFGIIRENAPWEMQNTFYNTEIVYVSFRLVFFIPTNIFFFGCHFLVFAVAWMKINF